uniref:Uncharacterized protein n=2 Tax=Lygus hesperus TaxID=30085 RepID=A0A146KYT9_LYGHE
MYCCPQGSDCVFDVEGRSRCIRQLVGLSHLMDGGTADGSDRIDRNLMALADDTVTTSDGELEVQPATTDSIAAVAPPPSATRTAARATGVVRTDPPSAGAAAAATAASSSTPSVPAVAAAHPSAFHELLYHYAPYGFLLCLGLFVGGLLSSIIYFCRGREKSIVIPTSVLSNPYPDRATKLANQEQIDMTTLQQRRSSVSNSLGPCNDKPHCNSHNQVKNFLVRYTECCDDLQQPSMMNLGTLIDPPHISTNCPYSNVDTVAATNSNLYNPCRSSIQNAIPHPTLLVTTSTPPIPDSASINAPASNDPYIRNSYYSSNPFPSVEEKQLDPPFLPNSSSFRQQYTLPHHTTATAVPYSPQLQPSPSSPSMKNHQVNCTFKRAV